VAFARGRRGYSGLSASCTSGHPDDPTRRFCDLHNLVCDPATLVVAWSRVGGNRGSRSAGVDGQTNHVEQVLVLRGWCAYFRHEVSKQTFNYLRAFTWRRVVCWLRRKHPKANWRWLRRRYLAGWWPTGAELALFNPGGVAVSRYCYRGTKIA
jgi:hypothetical protein